VFSRRQVKQNMALTWNIVAKDISPGEARIPLEKKLRQKISKFEMAALVISSH
jgi:hypothetical protein